MFDNGERTGGVAAPNRVSADASELPLERLEAEITTLAGHLAAATCRWLVLVAEFDRREGWRCWEQASCAAWLSWQCGVSLTTAHEHVRVARTLAALPLTTEAFAAGRLSYSKVRAITRVADAGSEDGWLSAALGCTAAQLDRLARACSRVTRAESEGRAQRERVSRRYDEQGMLVLTARLAPERGARVVAALEEQQLAAAEHTKHHDEAAEDGVAPCGLPDALLGVADTALAQGPRTRDGGDTYRVVIHADASALSRSAAASEVAEGRCHVADGPAVHPATVRRETCGGATSETVVNGIDGTAADAGRTTRTVPARLRRLVMDRAGGRCQYPGCERKAWLQIHHVQHWIDGGPTSAANLCVLCSSHHRARHTGQYEIVPDARAAGRFRFARADGTTIPHVPEPPPLGGTLAERHPATIAPDTIQPDWHGEPLDLDYAVSVLTSARVAQPQKAAPALST